MCLSLTCLTSLLKSFGIHTIMKCLKKEKKKVWSRTSIIGDPKVRLYSCCHCEAEYIAYLPDDVHSESDVNEIADVDIFYQCIKWGRKNKLYWGRPMT